MLPAAKRADALSWDDFFMWSAMLASRRSKDPSTQVGACIVDADRRIVGLGYHGFPRGCSDDDLPWARDVPAGGSELDTKYRAVAAAARARAARPPAAHAATRASPPSRSVRRARRGERDS